MREIALHIINVSQGINSLDLVLKVMEKIGPSKFDKEQFELTMANIIQAGEVVEVEYVLPQMNYKLKTMYFPRGTRININNWRGL